MTIIFLGVQSPARSSDTTRKVGGTTLNPSLFGLAPDGVYRASLLPDCWRALTSPFHPYHLRGGFLFYGTFPKVTLARRYLASCPMELGLSSSLIDSQPSFILASIQFIIANNLLQENASLHKEEIILFCESFHRNSKPCRD